MADQRLPIVDSDDGVWGVILRQYLMKEHYDDGTNNAANGGHQKITIRPGTTSAGTAPLKFTSGALMTTAETGAMEYDGTGYYVTPSSATRKRLAMYDTSGATGDIYYRDASNEFKRVPIGSTGDMLTVASGIPSWTASIVGKALDNTNSITLKDTNFTLQDNGDTSKQLQFDLAGLTSGTTTLTVPNGNTTLVGTDTAQVLTNKSLTAPKIDALVDANGTNILSLTTTASAANYLDLRNNIAGFSPTIMAAGTSSNIHINLIPKGVSGRITENGVEVTTISRVQTFTNKTLDSTNTVALKDTNFTLQDNNDATKQLQFELGSITAGTTRTLTVPNASTTLVGTDTSQILTNKTLTDPRINYIKDTNGSNILGLVAITSAVNYVYLTNQSAGNWPTLGVDGADTDIGFSLAPKGNAAVRIFAQSGVTPTLDVAGPDTNLNLNLVPKGSGKVQANGIEIVSVSGAQALTNKNLTSGTNTFPVFPVANGGTGRSTNTTAYGIIAAGTNATNAMQTIAPGTSGQFLKSAGGSALATFANIAQSDVTNLTTDLAGKAATSHTHTASQISDATTVGRAVLTAVDAAAARTAIGAGTASTKADVGLGNVDNTSDATKNSASATLTSKTIALGSNTVTGTLAQFNTAVTDAELVQGSNNGTPTSLTLWKGTQAQYNALGTYDSSTIYVVTA